ncbi:GntR family transcriptional regulator [Treponema brennaborense]|uniref:Transcriptional regulator, GntR family n=1 Tax=Treponema brennaborense (strain DSM 12168 / CIP 105900 / DD5/3) TaxID=906968 RepID=F4LNN7_TREBD|nr:GntR family transcriptional regulator [Treponema brennaborense]AEE16872.1 transcriptional regulator, GntR family [Treponema brennaborense DSM 12168]
MTKQEPSPHEAIYTDIQQRIRSGTYAPGEKLSETRLAEEFNCSRMPVREAFKHLEQDGLVSIQPKSGTYVRTYTADEIRNAIEIRAYLEALAFSLLIERDSDISPIRQYLDNMETYMQQEPFDLAAFGENHYLFHRELVIQSGNPLLVELYDKLHLNAVHKMFFSPMNKRDMAITHSEHKKIVTYIQEHNPKGEKFIILHLWNRKRNMLLQFAARQEI